MARLHQVLLGTWDEAPHHRPDLCLRQRNSIDLGQRLVTPVPPGTLLDRANQWAAKVIQAE